MTFTGSALSFNSIKYGSKIQMESGIIFTTGMKLTIHSGLSEKSGEKKDTTMKSHTP